MESKAQTTIPVGNRCLRKLSMSIGDFIRYWGFRRVHGAIWTQLYISKKALSCKDLTERLALSKALISPALDELCGFRLIKEAPSPNEKTKLYVASENINEVIQHILKTREEKILKQINQDYSSFSSSNLNQQDVDGERVKTLGEMIIAANVMLELFLSQKDLLKMPLELES